MIYRGNDVKRIKRFTTMTSFIDAFIKTLDDTYINIWR